MKFAYTALPLRQASPGATGAVRYRPLVPIHVVGPRRLPPVDGCIDSAADDTVFPPHWSARLGINVGSAPTGRVRAAGGAIIHVHFAPVTLLLADGREVFRWDAVVGFSTAPLRWALLGHSAFLDLFDVHLLGARREVLIEPNSAFTGQHLVTVATP